MILELNCSTEVNISPFQRYQANRVFLLQGKKYQENAWQNCCKTEMSIRKRKYRMENKHTHTYIHTTSGNNNTSIPSANPETDCHIWIILPTNSRSWTQSAIGLASCNKVKPMQSTVRKACLWPLSNRLKRPYCVTSTKEQDKSQGVCHLCME